MAKINQARTDFEHSLNEATRAIKMQALIQHKKSGNIHERHFDRIPDKPVILREKTGNYLFDPKLSKPIDLETLKSKLGEMQKLINDHNQSMKRILTDLEQNKDRIPMIEQEKIKGKVKTEEGYIEFRFGQTERSLEEIVAKSITKGEPLEYTEISALRGEVAEPASPKTSVAQHEHATYTSQAYSTPHSPHSPPVSHQTPLSFTPSTSTTTPRSTPSSPVSRGVRKDKSSPLTPTDTSPSFHPSSHGKKSPDTS